MQIALDRISHETLRLMRLIGQEADRQRLSAYVVGGFVRDILLSRENLDIDVVFEGDAIEIAKRLAQKGKTALSIYEKFGTATLHWPNGIQMDLATARKETYERPGALPTVERGMIGDDLLRRDFTINAMAIGINQGNFGMLIDDFKGMEDLKAKKIRVFHDQSFMDDPTRILRAIRFEQRFGFQMEKKTRALLEEAIRRDAVIFVTPGRYFEEFKKFFSEPGPLKCLGRLYDLKGLGFIDPGLVLDDSQKALLKEISRIILWFEAEVREGVSPWLIYFMALVDPLSLEKVREVMARLALARRDQEKVLSTKTEEEVVSRLSLEQVRPSQVYRILRPLSFEAMIFYLANLSSAPVKTCIEKYLLEYRQQTISTRGDDLIRQGVTNGREIGRILQELLFQKIDGRIVSAADEKAVISEWAQGMR